MSRLISTVAIDGAADFVLQAEHILAEAIREKGADFPVAFPDTNYFLPVIYSFTGKPMRTLADLEGIMAEARAMLPPRPADDIWLPYLGHMLDAGAAALFACEVIEACQYIAEPRPAGGIYLGAANDVIMRERGLEFVDGTAPGFAAVTGAAPSSAAAVKIARELQQKNLYVFMGGGTNGITFAEQLVAEGVQLGWETRLVPFGRDVSSLVYALGFASRAALSFGGVKPGDYAANLKYNKNRIFAFIIALGDITAGQCAAAAGALNYGFPVIADTDIPQILPTGICTNEHVVSNVPLDKIVEKALEVRGCKIKITRVPIPVPYGPAFEGERIRKNDTHAEFGGNKSICFEFVTSAAADEIMDGDIELIGPDIDEVPPRSVLPLGIWVEAAGRKMQTDFEPILERQIHHLLNGAEGIWHMGQRDIVWTRVSQNGFEKGLRIKDYGRILHAKFLADYPAIVDKVKVTLITDQAEAEKRLKTARRVYDERNRRLEAMTDESVDTFYSCLLCQSFAPNHVCVITPERLGLCGAYNWLDGKAAYEIDETGPNQPLKKGACLDPVKGVWAGVNDYVYANSHKTVDAFAAYSIMDRPMTSCGCFEAIVAYVPECNGVMVVNREYLGETPVGMTFSTLAGSVGGGVQTPGFIGCGKVFLTSRKFIAAEGGFRRLVWMPKELKETLGEDLKKRLEETEEENLLDKIADETITSSASELRAFMEKVNHPALGMEDMGHYMEGTETEISGEAGKDTDGDGLSEPSEAGAASGRLAVDESAFSPPVDKHEPAAVPSPKELQNTVAGLADLKAEISAEIRQTITRDVVSSIISALSEKFLGAAPPGTSSVPGRVNEINREDSPPAEKRRESADESTGIASDSPPAAPAGGTIGKPYISAASRLAAVRSVPIPKEKWENRVWTVQLGRTRAEGGTRGKTYKVGGASAMPFHLWEGEMPHRPLIAMEIFDRVSEKYPPVLRAIFGDTLRDPARMAQICVREYGADVISVRLDGTHPERGGHSAAQAVALVGQILQAVDVPLIITGHSHYEKNNEVMKAVAQRYEGENLLFNWVEQDNYRTIAGAAIAYGHSVVAQSPIDVNIGKQLNILLTNMDIKPEQIIMDPMASVIGYGIEYTYSVMERIRLTGLGGDKMLCAPMIVSIGPECIKIKEFKAPEEAFPHWGELSQRAALWEMATAVTLLQAGADILIMYHPEAVKSVKRTIYQLMDTHTTPSGREV